MASSKQDPILKDTNDRIKKLNAQITQSKNNLKEAKNKVEDTIVNKVFEMADDSIYEGTGLTEEEKKNQIKDMPVEKQLRILAEYGIDDEIASDGQNSTDTSINKYEKDLMDAQKAKDDAKRRLKAEAQRVIAEFNKIIETNQEIVNKLEQSIEKKESEAKALRDKLAGPGKPADPDVIKNRITAIEADLVQDKDRLDKTRRIIDQCKNNVESAIIGLENDLAINEKIYLGEDAEEKENAENTAESQEIAENSYQGYENEVEGAPKSAVAALRTMQSKSNADLKDCLKGKTYEDILAMTKHLGPVNRRIVRRRFEELLDNKYNDGDRLEIKADDGSNIVSLSKEQLKNLNKLDKAEIDGILRKLSQYSSRYSTMKPQERAEFDSNMETIKMAMVLAESNTGRLGRFFRQFGSNKSRFNSLGNAVSELASKQQAREDAVYKKEDSLRERLHVKTTMPKRNVRVFDTRQKTKAERVQDGEEWVR